MMKRKILAVTIPVVGCLTVVGAGFSAWYFSTATGKATDEFGVNINVTEEVKDTKDTLKIVNSNANTDLKNNHLILDQGGFSNKEDATKGIMFATSKVNETVDRAVSYTFNLVFTGDADLTLNKIYDAKMEVALSVSFDLGANLSQYITPVSGAHLEITYPVVVEPSEEEPSEETKTEIKKENFTNSGTVYTAEFVLEATDLAKMSKDPIQSFTWNFKLDLSTEGLANKLFQYVEGKKPQTGGVNGELEKMTAAVGSSTLNFTTSASIREKKTNI